MSLPDLPPRLRCEGGQLIKPNGEPIDLRGVSFGAWGEDSPFDAEAVADMGANCVRIGMRWHGHWGSDPDAIDARDDEGYAWCKQTHVAHWLDMIAAAAAAGLWVIPFVDSNCGQCGTQNPETQAKCDPKRVFGARGRNFYTDFGLRRVFTTVVWPTLARRLRIIPRIAMLELHPEPAVKGGQELVPAIEKVYREAMAAIRGEADAHTPFLVGAYGGYNIKACEWAHLPERDDCVYTGNLLSDLVTNVGKFDQGLQYLVDMRHRKNVPIFVQQLGRKTGEDMNLHFMRHALERMHAQDVGYCWWQWKQNTSSPGAYGLHYKNELGGWIEKSDELALLRSAWTA